MEAVLTKITSIRSTFAILLTSVVFNNRNKWSSCTGSVAVYFSLLATVVCAIDTLENASNSSTKNFVFIILLIRFLVLLVKN
jgi:hypothetical protein